jgi:hypothetical protein
MAVGSIDYDLGPWIACVDDAGKQAIALAGTGDRPNPDAEIARTAHPDRYHLHAAHAGQLSTHPIGIATVTEGAGLHEDPARELTAGRA